VRLTQASLMIMKALLDIVCRVGPPLLLVVRDMDLSQLSSSDMVKKICSVSGCDSGSMLNQITLASRSPHRSSMATPAASWLDDFSSWISPSLPKCCRVNPQGPCPPPDQPPCSLDPSLCQDCQACVSVAFEQGRPSESQFQHYLPWFLSAIPSEQCAKGGAGVYTDSIEKGPDGSIKGLSEGVIASSSFRAYYTPLNEQQDFIAALRHTRSLVKSLKESLGLNVYSYSMFHVFFEQYLTIYRDGALLALSPLPVIFTVILIATGSLRSSLITTSVLASLLIHLLGAMFLAGIQLNAISLVNLAMSLGIGVEFAAHISHSFSVVKAARAGNEARMARALDRTGPSVLIGITLTKLVGVSVLSLARTQIFEIYFFRLYLALVALGAAHGLVLLPVLLMWIGA
jgi:Niemann-Pick C1 protein